MPRKRVRCWWANGDDPLYAAYHDEEWGVPLHDDRKLFEMLLLEGFQAGLSWITILRKRENFRKAFREFDPEVIVRFKKRDLERLMGDAGIVRNRVKIEGSVQNAWAFLASPDGNVVVIVPVFALPAEGISTPIPDESPPRPPNMRRSLALAFVNSPK